MIENCFSAIRNIVKESVLKFVVKSF